MTHRVIASQRYTISMESLRIFETSTCQNIWLIISRLRGLFCRRRVRSSSDSARSVEACSSPEAEKIEAQFCWRWCNFTLRVAQYFNWWQNLRNHKWEQLLSKGSPHRKNTASIWVLPVWGGGLLGHLFREELSKFKWAFAWLWGVQSACQDGLGHLCSETWSSNGHLLLLAPTGALIVIVFYYSI